jgi:hypothetical protein
MPCHAMHPMQDYFWKVFHKYYNLICTPICTKIFILAKSGCYNAPEQGYNHNLDSVALNNPCPVSQPRVVSHSRTRCRESGAHEHNHFLSFTPMQVYNTPFGSQMETKPPHGDLGHAVNVSCVDGGHSQNSVTAS